MSFSPRNVSQLLVADTAGTVSPTSNTGVYTIKGVRNVGAADGQLVNNGVVVTVKTASGVKVSDFIPSNAIFKPATIAAGVAQAATLTVVVGANPLNENKTYVAKVVLHDNIGSMLNERFVAAYVSTDKDGYFVNSAGTKAAATTALVATELKSQLAASLARSNEGFTVANTAGVITVTGSAPTQKIGAIDGIENPWELTGGEKDNTSGVDGAFFETAFAVAVTAQSKPDDLVQLKNIEWFNSGYDKDPYRNIAWPASFDVDSNITAAAVAVGDAYGIFQFYKDRDATNLERQHRQLIVVGSGAAAIYVALHAVVSGA